MTRSAYRNETIVARRMEIAAIRNAAPVRFSHNGKLRFLAAIRATPAFLAGQSEIETRARAMDGIGGSAARGAPRMAARGKAGDAYYSVGSADVPVSYATQAVIETSADRLDTGGE